MKTDDAVATDEVAINTAEVADNVEFSRSGGPSQEELSRLTEDIIAALKTVYDPEIPADVYELGLIYSIDMSPEGVVMIDMTLTAPGCPVAGEILRSVENAVGTVRGVSGVKVNLVFEPPWDQSRMSDEARITLNML